MDKTESPLGLASNDGVGQLPARASACGLTECAGKQMCERCVTWATKPMDEGDLWSWVRSVMEQAVCIQLDYATGNVHKSYEAYSARLDAAASERANELLARLITPNLEVI